MEGQNGRKFRFPYAQCSTGLFFLLCLLMLAAYLYNVAELMGAFYFGLLIIYRVVMGMVVKRYFWHWAEEKTGFYSLLVCFVISAAFLALLIANAQAEGTVDGRPGIHHK